MSRWPVHPLGKLCEIVGGGTPRRDTPEFFGGDIPWATPTDVTSLDRPEISLTKERITKAGLVKSSTKLLPAGSVLLTSRATIGFTAVTQVPMCTNQGFANLICGPDVLPEYLSLWLPSQKEKMLQLAGGTTFKEISKSSLKTILMPLPPLAEQRRIVDLLNHAAGIRRLRQQALETARALIPALFVKMFGDPARNEKGWEVARLGEVLVNHDSRRIPLKSADRDERQGPYPYYGASGVIDSIDNYIFDGRFLLIGEDGANLLARSTPIAFIAEGQFWVNNHAHILGETIRLSLDYAETYFSFIDLREYVTGSAQPKLNQAQMNRIPILLPPRHLQDICSKSCGRSRPHYPTGTPPCPGRGPAAIAHGPLLWRFFGVRRHVAALSKRGHVRALRGAHRKRRRAGALQNDRPSPPL